MNFQGIPILSDPERELLCNLREDEHSSITLHYCKNV
jgi:hypothetical protein